VEDTQVDPSTDEDLLLQLRTAAEQLVNPWPKGQALSSLSPTRQKTIQRAAQDLIHLARGRRPAAASAAPKRSRSARRPEEDLAQISPSMEAQVGVSLGELTNLFILDALKGFGPQKFKALHDHHIDPETAARDPAKLPLSGKTGDGFRASLTQLSPAERELALHRAARQIVVAAELQASILTYHHEAFPPNVLASNNPVPVLYARGDLRALTQTTAVACVGSRDIADPYAQLQAGFAGHAANKGVCVVSGFALGADTVAHRAAVEAGGATVCVMPGGLDRPFPPENKALFEQLLATPHVAFISEFTFGTAASSMNLRKRNKLIVAAALGVLVGQSAADGGAMNAFRFAVEQHKPVATFAGNNAAATSGHEVIGRETKVKTTTFPLAPAAKEWDAWLSQLS
jgi:DNA protecting protein DprA